MKYFLNALLLLALLVKCSEPNGKTIPQQEAKLVLTKPGSSYADSLLINDACVVFYQPDSLQKEKIKAVTTPAVFQSSMHEFFYQQRNARIFLNQYWPNLKQVEVNNKRFLHFVKDDQTSLVIDLDARGDSYGMFVFDGKKEPRQIDMTNIETEIPQYYQRR